MKPTIINIKMPTSWSELDDDQLYYVYNLLADNLSAAQIKTYCMFLWGKLKVVCRYGDGYLIRRGKTEAYITAAVLCNALHALDFIERLPDVPVRIGVVKGHAAVEATLQGVAFERYLYVENLYQGYLHSQQHTLLTQMGEFLYDTDGLKMNQAEKMNVFYWWTSLKAFFAKQFPHFLQPSHDDSDLLGGGSAQSLSRRLQDSMNAQIRALTKGDITKERDILNMDTWRALTELDALAREYEEINRKYGKS